MLSICRPLFIQKGGNIAEALMEIKFISCYFNSLTSSLSTFVFSFPILNLRLLFLFPFRWLFPKFFAPSIHFYWFFLLEQRQDGTATYLSCFRNISLSNLLCSYLFVSVHIYVSNSVLIYSCYLYLWSISLCRFHHMDISIYSVYICFC